MRLADAILDALPVNIALLRSDGEIVLVNETWRAFAKANGAGPANVNEGCNYLAICDNAAREGCALAASVARDLRALLEGQGTPFSTEYPCDSPQKSRWFSMEAMPVSLEGQCYVVVRHAETTALHESALALKQTERRFASILENTPVYILLLDAQGVVQFINRVDTPDVTKNDILGRSVFDTVAPAYLATAKAAVKAALERGEISTFSLSHMRKDGSVHWFTIRVGPLRDGSVTGQVVWSAADVTEQHALEEQLLQAQKMDSIGQLAGGIAHDFNNLLTAIIGHAELLRLHTVDANHERASQIVGTANRAADLTRKLLAFSRKQMLQPLRINLNDVVRDVVTLIGNLIGREVRIETQLDPSLPSVLADPTQIEQVLINLAVNARDAMPHGGTITIGTDTIEVDTGGKTPGMKPGRYVVITVADTGLGMDSATIARAFEPFFTTKEKDKGTGLGLSVVHGIVKQSGGYVSVESEPGKGTIFYLCFPVAKGSAEVLPRRTVNLPQQRGHEHILLIDDESAVREIAVEILKSHGYEVTAAPSGAVALELAKSRGQPFDLVVADVSMPGLSGPEVALQLRKLWPNLRVLLVSGYSDEALVGPEALGARTSFLQKPYGVSQLGARVREVLDTADDA